MAEHPVEVQGSDARSPETVVTVTDRTWRAMALGAGFARWPGATPEIGDRVTVFDCNLDFTQHDVVAANRESVRVGPAIPWEDNRAA